MEIQNKLVIADSKTTAPIYVHFGSSAEVKNVISVSITYLEDGIYGECYGIEWNEDDMRGLAISLYYSKDGYLFEIAPTTKEDLQNAIKNIDKLIFDSVSIEDFKRFKKDMQLKNSDIAKIVGLTTDSVKTMTQPNRELPSWAKAMIYVWKRLK